MSVARKRNIPINKAKIPNSFLVGDESFTLTGIGLIFSRGSPPCAVRSVVYPLVLVELLTRACTPSLRVQAVECHDLSLEPLSLP